MSAVSGSVASGHTVPKDRCAESVLQRPPLSRRGIRPRNVAGRNCRLCSAPWMVIDVTEPHNLADGNAEKLQRLGLLNQSMIMRLRSSRFSGSE